MEMFIFFLIVGFVVYGIVRVSKKKETNDAWDSIANELGLTKFDLGQPELRGNFHGRPVRVRVTREGGSGGERYFTSFEVKYENVLDVDFQLTRQGFLFDKKLYGHLDIETGDHSFDEAAIVRGKNEAAVKDFFLSDKARAGCENLLKGNSYSRVEISNTKIAASKNRKLMNGYEVREILNHLLVFVRLLEDENKLYLERKQVNKRVPVSPPPLPQRSKEVEVPEEWHGEEEVAVEISEPEVELALEEPEVEEVVVEEKVYPVHSSTVQGTVESIPEESGISIRDVADCLGGEETSHYQALKWFESDFFDQEVEWTGKLEKLDRVSGDRVFAGQGGSVAVVDVGEGFSIKWRIGQDRADQWESDRDQEVKIRGKLIKYDPFSKYIYIESGDEEKAPVSNSPRFESYADKLKREMKTPAGEVKSWG